jgi:nitrous oxide reductase accessory protein NosL
MVLMTWTADQILIELRAVYGADLSFADCWARWKADNPDYLDTTAWQWYVTNGAIGSTYADAAFDYWHSLAAMMQILAEDGSHLVSELNQHLVTES